MARKTLASLVDDQLASGPPGTPEVPKSQSNGLRKSELAESRTPGLPKYLRLVRKEARLTEEQIEALTALSRRLNRRRGKGEGERITENTLIRVAVEVFLRRADELRGATEDELLASLNAQG